MRLNDLLHLIAFSGKAHGTPPAPGFVTAAKMPEPRALSKFSDHFSRYIPLSDPWANSSMAYQLLSLPKGPFPGVGARIIRRRKSISPICHCSSDRSISLTPIRNTSQLWTPQLTVR